MHAGSICSTRISCTGIAIAGASSASRFRSINTSTACIASVCCARISIITGYCWISACSTRTYIISACITIITLCISSAYSAIIIIPHIASIRTTSIPIHATKRYITTRTKITNICCASITIVTNISARATIIIVTTS
jgi:hypothetical protein